MAFHEAPRLHDARLRKYLQEFEAQLLYVGRKKNAKQFPAQRFELQLASFRQLAMLTRI